MSVSGSGDIDYSEKYSSEVGGGSYYWYLYTTKVEGDPITYKLSSTGAKVL